MIKLIVLALLAIVVLILVFFAVGVAALANSTKRPGTDMLKWRAFPRRKP